MVAGGSRCALADSECFGRLEWDHVVKQQRIRRQFRLGAYRYWEQREPWTPIERGVTLNAHMRFRALSDILGDTRNRRWLCSRHHELVTNHRVEAPIPESVWEFAREFGLDAQLENDIARRAA